MAINQIVAVGAQWAWGSSPSDDVSPEICLDSFPILTRACLTGLMVKGIGIAIILGACMNKAPLVINILKTQSVAGMSSGAMYGETIMYANSAFYSMLRNNPFTSYGENIIVTIQAIGVCMLMWRFKDDPPISMQQKIVAVLVFVLYIVYTLCFLQPEYYYLLMALNWPVLIYSRGSQMLKFYSVKHTGTQSVITNGMNLLGSCIRILTTIKEVGFDMTMLCGYFVSVFLNSILVTQFFMYNENTKNYLDTLEDKKKQ